MSIALYLCLVALTTNVAYASIAHKGKIFAVEKSDVSKIEVVSNDVVTFESNACLATDSVYFRATTIVNVLKDEYRTIRYEGIFIRDAFELKNKAFDEEVNFVNVFLVPDRLILSDNRVVHNTIYILNIPKNYDLPNKNAIWRFGSNIRC